MDATPKTKKELLAEIKALHQRLAAAEKAAADEGDQRTQRERLQTSIEFIADFDVLAAEGINLSPGGICFELREPLPFEMRFTLTGRTRQHRAYLAWMKLLPEGGCRCGFKFVDMAANAAL